MNRTFLTTVLVAALVGGTALLVAWYLSFGMAHPPDGNIAFGHMQNRARLSYYEDGSVSIASESEADAYRALGFHMGRDYPWAAALIRQTATGRLGEWFGDSVLKLDAFAHRLGFASRAEESLAALDSADRAVLTAFAQGMTRALEHPDVALKSEFVLFDVRPEPWEDWHSLAVGRLLAWLSEPPLHAVEDDSMFWPLRRHEDEDRLFRSWLHLHGADMSAAWSFSDATGRHFSGRLVYGATTLPLFTTVSMSWPSFEMKGVATIGTPFFPLAVGPGGARVSLLSSTRNVARMNVAAADLAPAYRYERIMDLEGDERIVSTAQFEGGILLNEPEKSGDSLFTAMVLRWNGLDAGSDWPAWRSQTLRVGALPGSTGDSSPGFRVIDGDGLAVGSSRTRVTGRPEYSLDNSRLTFVAGDEVARYAARALLDRPGTIESTIDGDVSPWARENAERLVPLITPDSSLDETSREALDYLANWDFRYDRSSIGASIFDGWMLHHRAARGQFPVIEMPDDSLELARVTAHLRSSFSAAMDSIAAIGGSDLARWRLEYFRPGRRFFPVWSFEPLHEDLPSLNRSRYAPIEIARPGHPTTIDWQPGLDDDPANSPSHILFSGQVGEAYNLTVTPDYEMGSGFIARYVAGPPRQRSRLVRKQVAEVTLEPDR